MLKLNVPNETADLDTVLLGIALQSGPVPLLHDTYDPKSYFHILSGTYPLEKNMINELHEFRSVLEKYGVTVLRPKNVPQCNQIFARDIGFVVDSFFFKSNILPQREKEFDAIDFLLAQIDPKDIIEFPEHIHVEGGDVIVFNDYIFVGYYNQEDYPQMITARTNRAAVDALQNFFPNKKVKAFELRKSNKDAFKNALHLDCCFQPVGYDKLVFHPEGFLNPSDIDWIKEFFGQKNCFIATSQQMYDMNCNVFSMKPNVVVSDPSFTALNQWFKAQGIRVESVSLAEVSKQGGMFRCSTLPLIRK